MLALIWLRRLPAVARRPPPPRTSAAPAGLHCLDFPISPCFLDVICGLTFGPTKCWGCSRGAWLPGGTGPWMGRQWSRCQEFPTNWPLVRLAKALLPIVPGLLTTLGACQVGFLMPEPPHLGGSLLSRLPAWVAQAPELAHHPIAVTRPHPLPGLAIAFGVTGLVGAVVVHLQQFGAAAAWNDPGPSGPRGSVAHAFGCLDDWFLGLILQARAFRFFYLCWCCIPVHYVDRVMLLQYDILSGFM